MKGKSQITTYNEVKDSKPSISCDMNETPVENFSEIAVIHTVQVMYIIVHWLMSLYFTAFSKCHFILAEILPIRNINTESNIIRSTIIERNILLCLFRTEATRWNKTEW